MKALMLMVLVAAVFANTVRSASGATTTHPMTIPMDVRNLRVNINQAAWTLNVQMDISHIITKYTKVGA
jgi:hypothetical protein